MANVDEPGWGGGGGTGIDSCNFRRMPMVMVEVEEGQEPQAPCSLRYTVGPSISTSSTFPPSAKSCGVTTIYLRRLSTSSTVTPFAGKGAMRCVSAVYELHVATIWT